MTAPTLQGNGPKSVGERLAVLETKTTQLVKDMSMVKGIGYTIIVLIVSALIYDKIGRVPLP